MAGAGTDLLLLYPPYDRVSARKDGIGSPTGRLSCLLFIMHSCHSARKIGRRVRQLALPLGLFSFLTFFRPSHKRDRPNSASCKYLQ